MIGVLGDALIAEFERAGALRARRDGSLASWLRQVSAPVPGVELVSTDGSTYTGLVIVDRNRPILMLAAEHGSAPSSSRGRFVQRPSRPLDDFYGPPDEPLWRR